HTGCRHGADACDRGTGAAHAGLGGQAEGHRARADRRREAVGGSAPQWRRSAKVSRRSVAQTLLSALFVASAALADNSATPPKLPGEVSIQQNLNAQLPLDLMFRDETGKVVRLRE